VPATILVVDDDRILADAIGLVLREEGFVVRVAHDGLAALAVVDEGGVALVLSDVNMPEMDGHALLVAMRLRSNPVPVVLMSAAVTPSHGPDGAPFLAKPFDLDELFAAVRAALSG
jgi:DNA-binding response OmpR family regulator